MAASEYYALMTQRWSRVNFVVLASVDYFAFFKKPLHTKDRMLQDFDFAIATVNGIRDFFGSAEGAHTIISNNKFFQTGQS